MMSMTVVTVMPMSVLMPMAVVTMLSLCQLLFVFARGRNLCLLLLCTLPQGDKCGAALSDVLCLELT